MGERRNPRVHHDRALGFDGVFRGAFVPGECRGRASDLRPRVRRGHPDYVDVGTWEIVYYKFMPDFGEKYAAHMVERAKASGASQQKVDDTERQAKQFKQMYDHPVMNVALTFMEVFPIGLAVTALSAGILRKKGRNAETYYKGAKWWT